jgi:hypothetical protein
MNEEHWASILFVGVLASTAAIIAIIVKSGWADWFIR